MGEKYIIRGNFDGIFRNNERGEMEDQIAKYSKQIFDMEIENNRLETENCQLKNQAENQRNDNASNLEEGSNEETSQFENNLERTIAELENKIEVCT